MSYIKRLELFDKLEEKRNNPIISYVTSIRPNASAQMSSDVISVFLDHIDKIPKTENEIDLIIVSNGGDPNVSWRLISILREKFSKVNVLLPYVAYSAATLLALGADKIIMHPYSNLGPVDPQLTYKRKNNDNNSMEQIRYSSEDIRNYMEFITNDLEITDQNLKEKAFELLCKDIGSIPIGVAKRSSQLSVSMGEKLLKMHIDDGNKAKTIAESLNSSFYHHGYSLGRKEASDIGLPVEEPSEEIEKLLWDIWKDYSKELKCNSPFDPIDIIVNSEQSDKIFSPIKKINAPVNLPKQAIQQIMQQNISIEEIDPIEYDLNLACLDSRYGNSNYFVYGKIAALVRPDMNISINNIRHSKGWVSNIE